jgi:monofunctional glycosyltransferase
LSAIRFIIAVLLLVLAGGAFYYAAYPDIATLKKENPDKTAFMQYREREWKEKGKKIRIQKQWAHLSRISSYLIKAVIIAEDDKFWSHRGFDIDAIQKALEKDLQQGKFKLGGSTISQQLVKNLYLSPEKSLLRKFKEALITWRMERTLSKRRILELYLNVVEWGEGIFGAEAASMHYFGKPASALGPEEAARLAAVLPNPRRFKADSESRYVEKRARIIYEIMVRRGIILKEYDDILKLEEGSGPGSERHNDREITNGPPSGESR